MVIERSLLFKYHAYHALTVMINLLVKFMPEDLFVHYTDKTEP